jgi:mRNA interferase MazF
MRPDKQFRPTVLASLRSANLRWSVAPGNVLLNAKHTGSDRDSVANVSQLVTVDKRQLIERVGKIPKRQMEAIFSGIDLVMGL